MALISRDDLNYDYTWSAYPGDNPMSDSTHQSGIFRRDEGSDVLAVINDYASDNEIKNKEEALRIEKLIRDKLGDEEMTKNEVRAWLENNMSPKERNAR